MENRCTQWGSLEGRRYAGSRQIGWVRSIRYIGVFILCMDWGDRECRPNVCWRKPLLDVHVLPQPQRCADCGRVLAEGLLPGLPEFFPRRRAFKPIWFVEAPEDHEVFSPGCWFWDPGSEVQCGSAWQEADGIWRADMTYYVKDRNWVDFERPFADLETLKAVVTEFTGRPVEDRSPSDLPDPDVDV